MFIRYWRVGEEEVKSIDIFIVLFWSSETIYDTICEPKVVTILVVYGMV